MLPETKGVPAVGRTRTFCQVMVFGVPPPALAAVTVKVSWVAVTEVIATTVPLTASLIFFELLVLPVI